MSQCREELMAGVGIHVRFGQVLLRGPTSVMRLRLPRLRRDSVAAT